MRRPILRVALALILGVLAFPSLAQANKNDPDNDCYCDDSTSCNAPSQNSPCAQIDIGDCDANDGDAFPGSAENESATLCMLDADGDGWGDDNPSNNNVTAGTDCDDGEIFAFPGAASIDSSTACMLDADGDNYGDNSGTNTAVTAGTDCDDSTAFAFPGSAPNDSNTACMLDADGDDYGASSGASSGVTLGTDCDDSDSALYPGLAPNDSTSACMEDLDGDDWGASSPTNANATAGSDCDDGDNTLYPGLAPNDSTSACMEDLDGDDWGARTPTNANAASGTDCDDGDNTLYPGLAPNDSTSACMEDDDGDDWGARTPSNANASSGTDCDDGEVFAFPGAAPNDSGSACMLDADGDDYGDSSGANANVTVGTDCDDGDSSLYPGLAPNDSATACMEDADGDDYGAETPSNGNATAGTDCNDGNASINPSITEVWYNGVDQDCDGLSDYDSDFDSEDRTPQGADCDDTDSTINTSATEIWYDGVDQDCDGASDYDSDLDLEDREPEGNDCDDTDSTVNTSATEVWYDGVDQDCDNHSDYDSDFDSEDREPEGGDCDDTDPAINTSATEVWYNGIDQDCDNHSDYDADFDGFNSTGLDCNDANSNINPSATEIWYDGIDQNCDSASDYDADGDGYNSDAFGGSDCDDSASAIKPGATEIWYDGTDQNCDGASDYDADGDLEDHIDFVSSDSTALDCHEGTSRDDTSTYPNDASLNPEDINSTATEVWYDGTDADCDGLSDFDADGDGYDSDAFGGTDCDDTDATINPGATEIFNDGIDQNCDNASDFDADNDGFDNIANGGTDCDDTDEAINPSASEIWYDGVDQNCDSASDYDADGDGDDHRLHGGTDCHEGTSADDTASFPNDGNLSPADINPAATDTWYDGTDQDCDGADDYDADNDGFAHINFVGGTDCHEGTAQDDTATYPNDGGFQPDIIHPGATDTWYDGVDQDCDGADDSDADGDGYAHISAPFFAGTDCHEGTAIDDTATYPNAANITPASINPAATEIWYDGTDSDCALDSDFDADSDGEDHLSWGGADCHEGTTFDDTVTYPNAANISPALINTSATEIWYDGTDQDCDGASDDDADGDGEDHVDQGGTDCHEGTSLDDTSLYPNDGAVAAASINAAATESWYDGTDQDCDGLSDFDADLDGEDHVVYSGTDCHEGTSVDDTTSYPNDGGLAADTINAAASDTWYDGTDQDCDGLSDYDADLDGEDHVNSNSTTGTDCNEGTSLDDTTTYPNDAGLAPTEINTAATEVWYDGTDADCDGLSDYDADYDGVDSEDFGGTDCNDADATVSPLLTEACETGTQIDNDCDGDPNTSGGSPYPNDSTGVTAYEDQDGDGQGARWQQNSDGTYVIGSDGNYTAYSPVYICSYETGWVNSGNDCDDYDSTVYPGAVEICNGQDEDCDNIADDPPADGSYTLDGCVDLFRDLDGDGYGDDTTSQCLCLTGSSTTATYNGDTYTDETGDCVDTDPDIYPIDPCTDGADNDLDGLIDYDDVDCNTCLDGLDNDGDGFTDSNDPDCVDTLSEPQEDPNFNVLRWNEDGTPIALFVDGDDNDCDGQIAAVELDCDDDGALPSLPTAAPTTGFQYSDELGLTACDPTLLLSGQTSAGVLEVPCWSDQDPVRLTCDAASGLWMFDYEESTDGFGSRYTNGKRVYATTAACSGFEDCDDQCASRCPDASESCDGIDNDCSSVISVDAGTYNSLYAGLPAGMIDGLQDIGGISLEEIDFDGDGVLDCGNFSASSSQPYDGAGSCDAIVADVTLEDCNALCGLTFPAATERCDGFLGDCDGAAEGTDADRDGLSTCGAWGTDEALNEEDIFVVVAVYGDGSSTGGGTGGTGGAGGTGGTGNADTAAQDTTAQDTTAQDTAAQDTTAQDTGGGSGGGTGATGGTGLDTGGVTVATFTGTLVPLILPRPGTNVVTGMTDMVATCDITLAEQLVALEATLGLAGVVDTAMAAGEESELVSLCTSGDPLLRCEVVQLTLTSSSDTSTCDSTKSWNTGYVPDCSALGTYVCADPVEEVTRTVWTRARILSNRRAVAEWECQELYGTSCSRVDTTADIPATPQAALVPVDQALAANAGTWWKELGRYNPAEVTVVTGWCWGDPSQDLTNADQLTGGDCDDASGAANRDTPEGPQDLLGIWQARQSGLSVAESCAVCLDGLDNNCDGMADCADPSCAVCFVGQGAGCGGGAQTPCAQAACSGVAGEKGPEQLWLLALALVGAMTRRRRSAR